MNIPRLRLAAQHVATPALDDPARVVERLGAVQAQDYLAGLWGVGLRTRGATEAAVEDAVSRGAIVRTWPMRRTLHFVAGADVRWMLALLAPRQLRAGASRYRYFELDEAVFARSARVAVKALEGGHAVERRTLFDIWQAAGIRTGDSRGLHIVSHLAQTGLICFGPRRGRQPTFVLLEEWVRGPASLPREVALATLARRYFTSHGPATLHDFAWWSGLTIRDAREGIEQATPYLAREVVGDRTYWFGREAVARRSPARAHLLPAWDEFTVAYRDRGDILDPAHARKVNAGGGVLKPVVVVGDRVVGTWTRALARESVVVNALLFRRLAAAESNAVAAAAARYGRFLGLHGEARCGRG